MHTFILKLSFQGHFIQYVLTSVKHEAGGNAHLSFPKHSSTQTSIPKINQHRSFPNSIFQLQGRKTLLLSEVKFVYPVSPGGNVKFFASGVNFSIFAHFLCFFLLKLLKLGEIDGVKFLA